MVPNAIAQTTAKVKTRSAVTVIFRLPESAVEGRRRPPWPADQRFSRRCRGDPERERDGCEGEGAGRSTVEKDLDWVAAPTATLALDGVKQEFTVAMRPAGPSTVIEMGGSFAGRPSSA